MRPAAEQLELLRRGIDAITPEAEFVKKLEHSARTGTPLRVKYGIDPTGIDVHLGHTVPLRKLRQFQDLGHTAVIIIGDYTAMVGDPSGRSDHRLGLTKEQVDANARDYLTQVGKIIDLDRAEIRRNGDWFGSWSFLDVLDLTRRMTIGQVSARDDFAQRIRAEKPVYLSECLYPLMQGWDSVEIRADVELGGTEQLFNLLVARDLQQEEGQAPQVAMTMPILVGTDGSQRMGKSLGNYIGVAEAPETQFGKVMSIPDEPMRSYFTLLTDLPLAEVDALLAPGLNPRDAKEVLGKAIVSQYHGPEAAELAAAEFRRKAKGGLPEEIPTGIIFQSQLNENGEILPAILLRELHLASSSSEGARLIIQGSVYISTQRTPVPRDRNIPLRIENGMLIWVGKGAKSRVVRIKIVEGVNYQDSTD
jgi:tyrosyl-tRNA synthetase